MDEIIDAERLLEDLKSDDFQRQYDVLRHLEEAHLSQDIAEAVLPTLIQLVDADNALLRMQAKTSLLQIADDHPMAVGEVISEASESLLELLDRSEPQVRATLVRALGASARLEVIEALDDRYENEVDTVQESIEAGFEAAVESRERVVAVTGR